MVALNRYRWPLPTDPSGPPMAYPEPMPTFMTPSMAPPATAAPPAPMAQAPAAPTDIAYPPTGFQEPQATPEASPEDDEFEQQMEEEQVEADWTRMTKRATAVLKVEADMQKARNAVAEAHKKATQRPSMEAPDEPLNRVFDKYVKGHAPMPTLEEYKASVRKPPGAEALSWTGEAPGFQDYILAGGQPEELNRIRKEEADRITLEKYAPQFISGVQGPPMTFEENRELVRRQREHREATMAPIRAKLADISERRKKLRRERKAPTAWDIIRHKEEVARIGAPQAKQYQPGIIENTATGEQQPYTWGEPIPPGFKIVKEASTVVNIGSKPASPGERTKIAEKRAALDALDNLRALYNESFVGPITGRIAPTQSLLEMTSEQQDDFMAATSAFKNAIIKEITGAQMSEVEAKRIMKQIPDITDPPQRWMAKWRQTRKNVESVHKRYLEILGQSGLAVPGETDVDITQISDEELRRIAGIE